MMGWVRVDEGGAELWVGEGAHVQRCRGWVDGTACGRPGDDGLRDVAVSGGSALRNTRRNQPESR